VLLPDYVLSCRAGVEGLNRISLLGGSLRITDRHERARIVPTSGCTLTPDSDGNGAPLIAGWRGRTAC